MGLAAVWSLARGGAGGHECLHSLWAWERGGSGQWPRAGPGGARDVAASRARLSWLFLQTHFFSIPDKLLLWSSLLLGKTRQAVLGREMY